MPSFVLLEANTTAINGNLVCSQQVPHQDCQIKGAK